MTQERTYLINPLQPVCSVSGQTLARNGISMRGVFDREVRRKPLAFAAAEWSCGIRIKCLLVVGVVLIGVARGAHH
jgi:hypothetical protein